MTNPTIQRQYEGKHGSNYIHGMSKTRFWNIWMGMKARCKNTNEVAYRHYGGRGIQVCQSWMTFKNFYDDMFPSYFDTATLERKDVNGHYEKSNCVWIPKSEQAWNTTKTVWVEYRGKRVRLWELAIEYGLNYHTLYNRFFGYKFPIEEALKKKLPLGPAPKNRKCSTAKCERKHVAKGLCAYHYQNECRKTRTR